MEDPNKILSGSDRLDLSIGFDPKSRTVVVRVQSHGFGTDIIIAPTGAIYTVNSVPATKNLKNGKEITNG